MRALIASLIAVLVLSVVPEAAAKTYAAERSTPKPDPSERLSRSRRDRGVSFRG